MDWLLSPFRTKQAGASKNAKSYQRSGTSTATGRRCSDDGPGSPARSSDAIHQASSCSPAANLLSGVQTQQLASQRSGIVSTRRPSSHGEHRDSVRSGLKSMDSATKLRAWENYTWQQTNVMDLRIKARQFRDTSKQKRAALAGIATDLNSSLEQLLNANPESQHLLLPAKLYRLQSAIQDMSTADEDLDLFEQELIQAEYALETNAPVAIDSSVSMLQLLQDHGYDVPRGTLDQAPSLGHSSTTGDVEPGDQVLRETLSRINSLEERIIRIKQGRDSKLNPPACPASVLEISAVEVDLSSEEEAEVAWLLQELQEAQAQLETLRPSFPLNDKPRLRGVTETEDVSVSQQSLRPASPARFISTDVFSGMNIVRETSLDDLLNEPVEPDIDLEAEAVISDNNELVHSWLFTRPSDERPPQGGPQNTTFQSARSEPLTKSQSRSIPDLVAAEEPRAHSLVHEQRGAVQSFPLTNGRRRPSLLPQRMAEAQPP